MVDIGGIQQANHAKFNGMQPAVKLIASYSMLNQNLRLTPNCSLKYVFLHQQGYQEQPMEIPVYKFGSKDSHLLQAGLGIKIEFLSEPNYKRFIPELHIAGFYDVFNTSQKTSVAFEDGTGAFVVKGDQPSKTTFNIGCKLNYMLNHNLYFSLNYDLYTRNKFTGNSGSLLVKYLI